MDEKLREALATGRELYAKKEYGRAESYLTEVAGANVPYADVYNMLGVVHHQAGQFSKALSCFEEALRINPAYTEAGLNLAVTYNDMGKYQEAKTIYLSALTQSTRPGGKLDNFVLGKLANMYADIAEVYASAGAFDEAVGEYRRALNLRPTFIDIRLKLSQSLRDNGQIEDALREITTATSQNPDFLPARIQRGLVEFSLGKSDAAVETLRSVLNDDEGNSRAKLYLDMILSHAARQLEGAKESGSQT